MSNLVNHLDAVRRQLLHKILTKHELVALRESAVWDLINGNRAFNGDVVVRSAALKGRVLTSDDSAVEMSRLQAIMTSLHESPLQTIEARPLYHLLLELEQLKLDRDTPTTIHIALYNKPQHSPPRLLSEVYSVDGLGFTPGDIVNKTLFTDLSAADIGDVNNEKSKICLVVKIITSEAASDSQSGSLESAASRERLSDVGDGSNGTGRRPESKQASRQSLLWPNKSRKRPDMLPKTSSSTLSLSLDKQAEGGNATSVRKDQRLIRRTTGIGLIDISVLMKTQDAVDWDIPVRSTVSHRLFASEADRGWDDFVRELSSNNSDQLTTPVGIRSITLQLNAFKHPSSQNLIREIPTVLQNVLQTQKISFSGVPNKPRTDIYFTFQQPVLSKHAILEHPKLGHTPLPAQVTMENLQLTMEVRNALGVRVENSVFPSSNSAGHTAWRTTAVDRGECWNQTVRLMLPRDEVPGAHVVMSLANGYSFPSLCAGYRYGIRKLSFATANII